MADTNQIVDQLSALTVLEIADLVKKLEEKWGVSAAAPVAVAAPAAGGGARDTRDCPFRGRQRCYSGKERLLRGSQLAARLA